jgi:probable HAF family extracellular repeat protein
VVAVVVAVASLTTVTTALASPYSVTDLGTFGGETSEANAINNAGQVAGTAQTSYTKGGKVLHHAFRYSNGKLTDLSPGGPGSGEPCSGCTQAYAINGFGDVAGSEVSGSGDEYPAVWRANGSPQSVPSPDPDSAAHGINDADEVVGGEGYGEPAWLDSSSGTTTLLKFEHPSFNQGGIAYAINNKGEVVGGASQSYFNAFLYSAGTMHNLGTLGGAASRALALNESGMIVGWSEITGAITEQAFSYHEGIMTDLGTLQGSTTSEALGVNEANEIVGTSGGRAFLYRDGTMTDLNSLIPPSSGWTLTSANGINSSGEIVGTGLDNGVQRGFLLTPNTPPAVETDAASSVSPTTASLNATVNPNGEAVGDCHFEYGSSTAYGSSVPCSSLPGSGDSPVAVSASLTGLEANTTYHVRIVATNANGTSEGSDLTFTTPQTPAAVTSNSGSGLAIGGVLSSEEGKVSPLGIRLASTSLATSDSGMVSIKVNCPAGEASCTGSVTLQTLTAVAAGTPGHHSRKHKAAILTLATGAFTVSGGHVAIVKLHLSRRARELLALSHRLRARAKIIAQVLPGETSYSSQETVVLRLFGVTRGHSAGNG